MFLKSQLILKAEDEAARATTRITSFNLDFEFIKLRLFGIIDSGAIYWILRHLLSFLVIFIEPRYFWFIKIFLTDF